MASGSASGPLLTTPAAYNNLVLTGAPLVVPCNPAPRENPLLILLLGPTGSGKSTFLEALAGEGAGLGISKDQLDGVTQGVVCYKVTNVQLIGDTNRGDHTIYIIDTPGFSDGKLSELKVFTLLMDWMKQFSSLTAQNVSDALAESNAISRIFYFHPITSTRVPGSTRRLFKMLAELAINDRSVGGLKSKEKFKGISIVTTMWDRVAASPQNLQRLHTKFDQLMTLNGPCEVRLTFVRNGSRVVKFENNQESAFGILDQDTASYLSEYQLFHLERMLVKNQDIRDGALGRPLYSMLRERVQRMLDEKVTARSILQTKNMAETQMKYWTEHAMEVETQLEEFQRELEDFGPSPVDSVVSFHHLFDGDVNNYSAPVPGLADGSTPPLPLYFNTNPNSEPARSPLQIPTALLIEELRPVEAHAETKQAPPTQESQPYESDSLVSPAVDLGSIPGEQLAHTQRPRAIAQIEKSGSGRISKMKSRMRFSLALPKRMMRKVRSLLGWV